MTLAGNVDLSPGAARRGSIDFLLVFSIVALSAIGLLMVFSASAPRLEATGLSRSEQVIRQAAFMGVGVVTFVVASLITDRSWRMLSPFAFVATLILLVVVLSPIGTAPTGAQRWIPLGFFNLQPSEVAKPAVILALAVLLSPPDDPIAGVRWSRIGKVLALVAVPSALIFIQPDLGTMLVFAFVSVAMLYVAGTSARQIGLLAVIG